MLFRSPRPWRCSRFQLSKTFDVPLYAFFLEGVAVAAADAERLMTAALGFSLIFHAIVFGIRFVVNDDKRPAINVSWEDGQRYVDWLAVFAPAATPNSRRPTPSGSSSRSKARRGGEMPDVKLVETSLRDGNQSLWGATGIDTASPCNPSTPSPTRWVSRM